MLNKSRLSEKYPDAESNLLGVEKYLNNQLQDEVVINIPQDKDCLISVVTPVYNEDLSVILKQLISIVGQKNISPNTFEVIYIVNNSSKANPEVIAKNTDILQLPIWKNRDTLANDEDYRYVTKAQVNELRHFNLFAIDKSSPGNEIPDCNVGKARNRGISEAVRRFFTNDRDGLIFQIDADSYYPDQTYFSRVIELFKENPRMVALCGGVELYFDVEKYTDDEKKRAKTDVSLLCDYLRWKSLKFLLLGKSFIYDDDFMSGPNMIAKCFPTAIVHGVPDIRRAEDVAYGERLQLFAEKYNLQYSICGAKDLFQVYTLLRLSGGLSNNIGVNIKNDDSSLMYTHDDEGKLVFKPYPYETAIIKPIPELYSEFKQLALDNLEAKFKEKIDRFEEKIEANEQFLLQQLK